MFYSFTIDSLIVVAYLALNLLVGIYSGRNVKSMKEFAIGDYKFSTSTLTATVTATWIGAGLTIGSHEKIYQYGIVWMFIFCAGIIDIFLFQFLSRKLLRFKGCISAAEVVGVWYGKDARIIVGICTALYSVGTIGTQIAAIGFLFKEFFGISPSIGIYIGAGIVVLYSSFGGIKSVTYTDVIQFAFFIVAIPIIAMVMIGKAGGYETIFNNIPSQHLKLFPDYGSSLQYIVLFLFFSIPFCDACLVQRALMAKNTYQADNTFKYTSLVMLFFYFVCAQIALSALSINPDIEPNNVLYYVINNYLPVGIKGIGIAGILAVVMSSADSYLNVSSITIINDVINQIKKTPLSQKSSLLVVKFTTLIIGSLSILFATTSESIAELMINTWILWAPIAVVPLYISILGIKSNIKVFYSSVITGSIFVSLWQIFDIEDYVNVENSVPAVILCCIAAFITTAYYKKYNSDSLKSGGLFLDDSSEHKLTENIRKFLYKACHFFTNFFNLLSLGNIANFSSSRVNYFGAQYKAYGMFAISSFLIPYFMWSNTQGDITFLSHDISIIIRFIAGSLAFGLITFDMWNKKYLKYLPLYWHLTLIYSIPFLTTFLFFYNTGFFYDWLMNVALSLFLLAMLVDWISFIVILVIGASSGYWFHLFLNGDFRNAEKILNDPHKVHLFLYVAFFSTLIGMLFSRNKELIQKLVVSILEQKVQERTAELEQSKNEVQKALDIKTRILANISHEIRTPVHGISCISQSLEDMWYSLPEDKKYKYVCEISKNSRRLAKFINNILDLSKFSLGKMNFIFEQKDLVPIIQDVICESEALYLQNDKIYLEFNTNKIKSVILYADESRISQLLRNLIGNAIRYTREGVITAEISEIDMDNVFSDHSESLVIKGILFSLKDSGIGIAEDELETIFEPFYQSSRTASLAGGTGLGLAICKEIVDEHKGIIWAENNSTKGAKFSFILPVEHISYNID